MHRLVILFLALAPSLVLLQYGIAKARARWDDSMIWEAYFNGGLAALLALLFELLLKKAIAIHAMMPVHGAATEAVFIAAIPEELAKFAVLFLVLKRYGRDTERHDMITLTFGVSLGFAAIENVGYLLLPGDWQFVALNRAALSVPMHGLDGLAMGTALTAAGLSPHRRTLWLSVSLAMPMLMHALFDFPLLLVSKNSGFAGVLPAWFFLEILMSIGVLWWCNRVRAAADYAYALPHQPGNPRLLGIAILVSAPLLALIAGLQSGNSVIAAAVMLIMPSIFGIDLLSTGSMPARSRAMPFGAGGND